MDFKSFAVIHRHGQEFYDLISMTSSRLASASATSSACKRGKRPWAAKSKRTMKND